MRYRKHTDAEGAWTSFWFEKNLQGDIVAVYNSAGTKILSYKYDAWGNFTGTTHATDSIGGAAKNPFRYRGYYYDSDLGFYVTGTRYYDPAIGRFINADSYVSTGQGLLGYNMYAYCKNNPVNYVDYSGEKTFSIGYSYSSPEAIETSNDVYGATFSVGVFMMQTDLESVENLEGTATNRGVNVIIGSYDLVNNDKDETVGFSVGLGPGAIGDYHVNKTETETVGSPFKSMMRLIKDWLGI